MGTRITDKLTLVNEKGKIYSQQPYWNKQLMEVQTNTVINIERNNLIKRCVARIALQCGISLLLDVLHRKVAGKQNYATNTRETSFDVNSLI